MVTANILAAATPAATGEIINVATGMAASINQIVDIIKKVSGRESPAIYADFRAGEVRHSRANIENTR